MKIEDLTLSVLAERKLTFFNSKRLVDWAVNAIDLGYNSDNLYILAGLDYETTEERENYFWNCIQDLNIRFEISDDELINKYAISIANQAINNKISIEFAFSQMLKIVEVTNCDSRYIVFCEIDEDLSYLKFDGSILYNKGLTLENSNNFILEELKIFLLMEKLNIPAELRKSRFCEDCKQLVFPGLKIKYKLGIPFKSFVSVCDKCGSKKFRNYHNEGFMNFILNNYK